MIFLFQNILHLGFHQCTELTFLCSPVPLDSTVKKLFVWLFLLFLLFFLFFFSYFRIKRPSARVSQWSLPLNESEARALVFSFVETKFKFLLYVCFVELKTSLLPSSITSTVRFCHIFLLLKRQFTLIRECFCF